jgi:hypothetical protein
LIVGHTHADVDALIGTIISYLRNVDQMSPAEFAEAVGEACKSQDGTIDRIDNCLSTANYASNFFSKRLGKTTNGFEEMRELRMTANPDADDEVLIHYKVGVLLCCNSI